MKNEKISVRWIFFLFSFFIVSSIGEGPQAPLFYSNDNTYILHKVTEKNSNASRGGISAIVATSSRMYIDKDVLSDPL